MTLRQQIAAELARRIPGCTLGLNFGHGALEIDDKVFAFVRSDESAAVKLPASLIAELITSNADIGYLTMGKRTMREWVVIPNIVVPHNLKLLHKAKAYVASLPKKEQRKPAKKASRKAAKKTAKTAAKAPKPSTKKATAKAKKATRSR